MGSAVKYQRTLFEPEHDLFRESYRSFLERHVAPYHDEWEKAKIVDRGVWLEAGKHASEKLGIPIGLRTMPHVDEAAGFRMGMRGAVLVRPDGHVAWRMPYLPGDPASEIAAVINTLLHPGRA